MKNPAIHILHSELTELLLQVQIKGITDPKKIADYILLKYPNSIQHRKTIHLKTKEKIVSTGGDVSMFLSALYDVRSKEGKGRYVELINGNSNQYNLAKEIAEIAENFCIDGKLEKVHGYNLFCEIGVNLMGKRFGLNKFKSNAVRIFEFLEYKSLVDTDPNQKDTIRFYQIYRDKIKAETGVNYPLTPGDYMRFINFYWGREEADKLKAKYRDFINAQFEGMKFLDRVPERYNLHGEEAKGRYFRYVANKKKLANDTESRHGGSELLNKI
jgi:hypothetical protein